MKKFNRILDDILYAVSIVGMAAVIAVWCGMAVKMICSDVPKQQITTQVDNEGR